MTPQTNAAQLKHAVDNGRKLIEAKKLEISAYTKFRDFAPGSLRMFMKDEMLPACDELTAATELLFISKIARAEVELEELELQVKVFEHQYKQVTSRVFVPGQN